MSIDSANRVLIRWDGADPSHAALLTEAAIDGVVLAASNEPFARACQAAKVQVGLTSELRPARLAELPAAGSAILTAGLWPGITRPPSGGRNDETASASREPWVDANGYLVGWLRALYPDRPAVLGYEAGEAAGLKADRMVPHDTVELALVEAWTAGGNWIVSLPAAFRKDLLAGENRARQAWQRFGQTARWLKQNAGLFGRPPIPAITAMVEPGRATAEIANLLYRRGGSPALARASMPPAPEPANRLALVAASLRDPAAEVRARILAHAEAGAAVVTDTAGTSPWWRDPRLKAVKTQQDREFFGLGKGQVVAYKKRIVDPSEFALDVIDIVTHPRRAVRLWNAPAVIPLATAGRSEGEALLIAVNYGSPIESEIQARIQGVFAKATLLRPEAAPLDLKPARRGSTTEVYLPELVRLGVVVFS